MEGSVLREKPGDVIDYSGYLYLFSDCVPIAQRKKGWVRSLSDTVVMFTGEEQADDDYHYIFKEIIPLTKILTVYAISEIKRKY